MGTTIKLDDIVFDSKIYPREKWSTSVIKEYVDVIRSGKPFKSNIVLEKGTNRLLDGRHRELAYKKYNELYEEASQKNDFDSSEWVAPLSEVPVEFHEIPEGVPAYLYALSLSARHGVRHTPDDKKTVARRVMKENPDFNLKTIAEYASVSGKTAKSYVEDLLAKRKEEQKYISYRLYLEGWTQEEIGAKIGMDRGNLSKEFFSCKKGSSENLPISHEKSLTGLDINSEFGKLETQIKDSLDTGIPHLEVAERFNMPLILVHAIDLHGRTDEERMNRLNISVMPYDVWTFGKCHDLFGNQHPGRIPGQLIAHVLYFFTQHGDMVIDPMSGSGTTQDVCLAMGRKCYAYDIDTRHERSDVIVHNMRQHEYEDGQDDDGNPTLQVILDDEGQEVVNISWHDRIKKANLIFWDPPYFEKMDKSNIGENGYIEGSISQLPRNEYLEFFETSLQQAYEMVKSGTKLAFLMSDWDDNTGEREGVFVWDYANIIRDAGWKLTRHIQVPLSTQQVHPDIVNKFRKSRRLARLERYLLIAEK